MRLLGAREILLCSPWCVVEILSICFCSRRHKLSGFWLDERETEKPYVYARSRQHEALIGQQFVEMGVQ